MLAALEANVPTPFAVRPLRAMTQLELIEHLLSIGLLRPRDVVEGRLTLRPQSRRNANVEVRCERVGYFVKQATDESTMETVAAEGMAYSIIHSDPAMMEVRAHVPALVHADLERGIVITEHLGDGRSMAEHHRRVGRFSIGRARDFGRFLAQCHNAHGDVSRLSDPVRPVGLWAESMARPSVDVLLEASAANLQLIKVIQSHPEFVAALVAVQADWDPTSLVHGDVKWDNVVIGQSLPSSWWLVDWELAGPGDPRWDVGCALAEYLRCWILTAPITGTTEPAAIPGLARYPLAALRPAMSALCAEYRSRRNLDFGFLADVARFAAARLLQVTYEHMQSRSAMSSQAICLTQLAYNVLRRPQEAVFELFGAGTGW